MISETIPSLEQIRALEQEIENKLRHLADLKRMRPPQVLADYELRDVNGAVPLSRLFGAKHDLIVVHNMGISCAYCTMWADGLNGLLPHLSHRAAFAMVTPDAPERQRAFADERGWQFQVVSSEGSPFTRDMGFEEAGSSLPGVTTLHRTESGALLRIASAEFGPFDPFCTCWHLFALLADGVAGWSPRLHYGEDAGGPVSHRSRASVSARSGTTVSAPASLS